MLDLLLASVIALNLVEKVRLAQSYKSILIGSQRRTKKVVTHQTVQEDSKIKTAIKKYGEWKNTN